MRPKTTKQEAIEKALAQTQTQIDFADNWFGQKSRNLKAVCANEIHGQWRVEMEWTTDVPGRPPVEHESSCWIA